MRQKKKGFTLIELLAVIVILAIIALIAVPIVLNLIEKARKGAFARSAEGVLKASKLYYASSVLEPYGTKEIIFDCDGEKCISNQNENSIELGIDGNMGSGNVTITETGKISFLLQNGKYCAVKSKDEEKIYVEETECSNLDLRLDGSVKLDSTNGSYTYPETRSFEVIENISGGELSCISSDEEVATCSITETTVTVVAGVKEGNATLTIKSLGNLEYKDATAAYLVTTSKGLLTVNASDVIVIYDGSSYGLEVTSEGATIKYGITEGTYDLPISPTYIDVGEYIVHYEVSKLGYNTVVGSKKIIITRAEGNIEVEVPNEIQYDQTKILEIKENISDGDINVTSADDAIVEAILNNGKIEITGKKVGKTTITVSSAETNNYQEANKTYEITVKEAENTLTLSSTSGNYTYPETKDIEVKENTSEGKLSCESNDEEVATCSITDNIITVVAGTKEGTATLTIKSEATENYNEASVIYLATTVKGTLTTINADGYSGVYDGKEHGIEVTCEGAKITYGTEENNYNLTENPKYIDVGVYTVYYKIEKAGYNEIKGSKNVEIKKAEGSVIAPVALRLTYTGSDQTLVKAGNSNTGTIKYKLEGGSYSENIPSATNAGTYKVYYMVEGDTNHNNVAENFIEVKINKASGTATLSSTSGEVQVSKTTTFTVSNATGTVSGCTSSNTSIATCLVSGTTVTVTGVTAGSATITVNVSESINYNNTSKKYSITIMGSLLSNEVKLGDYVSMLPSLTSYTIPASLTGFQNNQTIKPSELNLWRVININNDGTIEMVSEYISSTSVSFFGQTGYVNFVGALNTISKQYENSNYTIGSRHVGYNGQTEYLTSASFSKSTPWTYSTFDNSNEKSGGGDILYKKDTELIDTILGSLNSKKVGTTTTTSYWLASRNYGYSSTGHSWAGRTTNVYDSTLGLLGYGYYTGNSSLQPSTASSFIRPIIILKPELYISEGDGTSESPWVLN